MLSRGLVLVEKEGWLAKEERHDKVADKVAAVPVCVCVAVVCSFCGVCGRGGALGLQLCVPSYFRQPLCPCVFPYALPLFRLFCFNFVSYVFFSYHTSLQVCQRCYSIRLCLGLVPFFGHGAGADAYLLGRRFFSFFAISQPLRWQEQLDLSRCRAGSGSS